MIGVALGCGALMPRGRLKAGFKALWEQRAYFLVILLMANLPDIDYIPGVLMGQINAFHHWYTHTLGWIAAVAVASWLLWRKSDRVGWSVFAVLFAALASHLVADYFSADGSVPYGIMALWPFTDRFYISPESVFWSLRKTTWNDVFQWYNVRAALYEGLVILPVIGAVLLFKRFARVPGKADVGNLKLET
jgi:inner membrane protein